MKIRIQGNSIRFRLKQFETDLFAKNKSITEELKFSLDKEDNVEFILQKSNDDAFHVDNRRGKIIVSVPDATIKTWTETEQVGIETSIPVKDDLFINVLIEKDFKCLNGSDEDNVGSYPNPLEAC